MAGNRNGCWVLIESDDGFRDYGLLQSITIRHVDGGRLAGITVIPGSLVTGVGTRPAPRELVLTPSSSPAPHLMDGYGNELANGFHGGGEEEADQEEDEHADDEFEERETEHASGSIEEDERRNIDEHDMDFEPMTSIEESNDNGTTPNARILQGRSSDAHAGSAPFRYSSEEATNPYDFTSEDQRQITLADLWNEAGTPGFADMMNEYYLRRAIRG